MIIRIEYCGECPAYCGMGCEVGGSRIVTTYPSDNPPHWCPLRKNELKGLPDYREKEERVIASIPDELKELFDKCREE